MTEIPSLRTRTIASLLSYPRRIRDAITDIPGFREAHDIPTDSVLIFNEGGLQFSRSAFFNAVRTLYSERSKSQQIVTEGGEIAILEFSDSRGERLVCRVGDKTLHLPSFKLLSPHASDRVAEFDRFMRQYGPPDASAHAIGIQLKEAIVTDEEFSRITNQLEANPIAVRDKIRRSIPQGVPIELVVPKEQTYYAKLIGPFESADSLAKFVSAPCKFHVKQLLDWDIHRGLSLSLLIAAGHSSISDLIEVDNLPTSEVEEAFAWLAKGGNRWSQVAGIELGLRLLPRCPGIDKYLLEIIEDIRLEDPEADKSRISLTANLFIFVDGELARQRLFHDKPPFWRRLAALAQSGLYERELLRAGVDIAEFLKSATWGRGESFYFQSLVDLRIEPRWLPDFLSPTQLKMEFVARLVAAGEKLPPGVGSDALRNVLKGEGEGGLRELLAYPFSYFPGPLEGGMQPGLALPSELVEELRQTPVDNVLEADALAGLMNASLVYRIEAEHSRLAAEAIRGVRHQIIAGNRDGHAFAVLSGLAVVAAVTRDTELADDVRVVARVLRRRPAAQIEANGLLRIALIACASHIDQKNWAKLVGEWIHELSYESMSASDADALRSHVRLLCEFIPALWPHCAKADAALASVAGTA